MMESMYVHSLVYVANQRMMGTDRTFLERFCGLLEPQNMLTTRKSLEEDFELPAGGVPST